MMTKLANALLTVLSMSIPAVGQTLDCTQFRHNEDGSWAPISQLTVTSSPYGGQIYVGPRMLAGIDLTTKLNQQCLTDRKITRPR
jgi:hypothetical protein